MSVEGGSTVKMKDWPFSDLVKRLLSVSCMQTSRAVVRGSLVRLPRTEAGALPIGRSAI